MNFGGRLAQHKKQSVLARDSLSSRRGSRLAGMIGVLEQRAHAKGKENRRGRKENM